MDVHIWMYKNGAGGIRRRMWFEDTLQDLHVVREDGIKRCWGHDRWREVEQKAAQTPLALCQSLPPWGRECTLIGSHQLDPSGYTVGDHHGNLRCPTEAYVRPLQ